MGRLFADCMDQQAIDALGASVLEPQWPMFDRIQSLDDAFYVAGVLQGAGISAFASVGVVADALNPGTNVAEFDQGGLALPDRSLYLDAGAAQLRTDYVAHMTAMFALAGLDNPERLAADTLAVETLLANASLPGDQIRDPKSTYHKIDLPGLKALAPALNWDTFLKGMGAPAGMTQINVGEPDFFAAINAQLPSIPVSALRSYLLWQYVHFSAPFLSTPFLAENFNFFIKELQGQSAPTARNLTCIGLVNQALGDELGQAFVEAAFSGASFNLTVDLISEILAAFGQDLVLLQWMDPETLAQAQLKLSQVIRRVGYPQPFKNYTGYDVTDGQLYTSMLASAQYLFQASISTVGQPVDRNAWSMAPSTVNAYYEPTSNSINFPAGILQNPFFDASFDAAANYGAIGAVMGHELSHAFDDQGRQYDGTGKLRDWWLPSTVAAFEQRTACLVNQYSAFEVLPGVHVNGNLTLGENIADNGGVKTAYKAFQNHLHPKAASLGRARPARQSRMMSELTEDQLFFLSYGQVWCAKATDDFKRLRVKTDVHSPPRFRVLGPLQNSAEFAAAFQCKAGSPMNPTAKCELW
jgi:putative endopeptidase